MYIMPLAQEGTKIQWDWYGGWFSRLGPMGLRQGLCHIRMKCTVFHYQLVLVTFCYQLAKISMIFLIFFFYQLVPQYLWNLLV